MTNITAVPMPEEVVEGERFGTTLTVDSDLRVEPVIASLQADFGLCEADFLRLKNGGSKTVSWANGILLTTVGMALSVAGKIFSKVFGNSTATVEPWEWFAVAGGFVLALLLYLLGPMLPNERKKVMKDIENHFGKSPRTKHIVR